MQGQRDQGFASLTQKQVQTTYIHEDGQEINI